MNINIRVKKVIRNCKKTCKKCLSVYEKYFRKLIFFVNNIILYFKPLKSVTVIIPTYIDNEYIYYCIQSVLEQKKIPQKKLEIIIVVNGQAVSYYKKLKKLYSVNKNIKVIYTQSKGYVARNLAMTKVTKDCFTFLDDDDYLQPYFLYVG